METHRHLRTQVRPSVIGVRTDVHGKPPVKVVTPKPVSDDSSIGRASVCWDRGFQVQILVFQNDTNKPGRDKGRSRPGACVSPRIMRGPDMEKKRYVVTKKYYVDATSSRMAVVAATSGNQSSVWVEELDASTESLMRAQDESTYRYITDRLAERTGFGG